MHFYCKYQGAYHSQTVQYQAWLYLLGFYQMVPASTMEERIKNFALYLIDLYQSHSSIYHGHAISNRAFLSNMYLSSLACMITFDGTHQTYNHALPKHGKKPKKKFTLFSDHNGSLLRRQPKAMAYDHRP